MKKINNYIIEKLKLNKSSKPDEFEQRDFIVRLGVINYTDRRIDKIMVDYYYFYEYDEKGRVRFTETKNSSNPNRYSYEHDKFINSNGYHEYKGGIDSGSFSANVCYIDSETAKDILPKLKKNKSVLKNIFDKSDNIDWNDLLIEGDIDYILDKLHNRL
jgi:hypothetical protein